jgi:hypothetical protein
MGGVVLTPGGASLPADAVNITIERRGGVDRWSVIDLDSRRTLEKDGKPLVGTFREAHAAAAWLEREYRFVYRRPPEAGT